MAEWCNGATGPDCPPPYSPPQQEPLRVVFDRCSFAFVGIREYDHAGNVVRTFNDDAVVWIEVHPTQVIIHDVALSAAPLTEGERAKLLAERDATITASPSNPESSPDPRSSPRK